MNDIDHIFIITLDTSIERQEKIKQRFPELMRLHKFEWYITQRDNENTVRGAWNSHKNVLNISKNRGYSKIIIMEDDVDLLVPWNKFIQAVDDINYDMLGTWNIITLGYFPILTKDLYINGNKINNLVEIRSAYGMTGYIINVPTTEIGEFNGIDIDKCLLCNNEQIPPLKLLVNKDPKYVKYGIYPVLLRQNSKKSTIDSSHDMLGNFNVDSNYIVGVSKNINTFVFFIFVIIIL